MKIVNYKISREKIDNRDIGEKIRSIFYKIAIIAVIEVFLIIMEESFKTNLSLVAFLQVSQYIFIQIPIIAIIITIINPEIDIITIYFKDYETAKESQENTIDEIIESIIKNDIYSSNLKNGFYIKNVLSKKNKLLLEEKRKKDIIET